MSDDMRTQLTDFAAEFMAEAEVEQRLKEVFEKHMEIARVSKEAGNYEQLVESYIRTSAASNIFRVNKKERLAFFIMRSRTAFVRTAVHSDVCKSSRFWRMTTALTLVGS